MLCFRSYPASEIGLWGIAGRGRYPRLFSVNWLTEIRCKGTTFLRYKQDFIGKKEGKRRARLHICKKSSTFARFLGKMMK
jgi:hypothetical protein